MEKNGVDILLGEPLCKTSTLVAHRLDIPFVRLGPTDFSTPEPELLRRFEEEGKQFDNKARKEMDTIGLLDEAQFDSILIQELAALRINYSTSNFEGDKTDPAFTYVGSDPIQRQEKQSKKRHKVLYSSGTLFWDVTGTPKTRQ